MKNVLVVYSSLNGEAGQSYKAADYYLEQMQNAEDIRLDTIDLNRFNLPHLSQAEMAAWGIPADMRSSEQKALSAYSDNFVKQLLVADEIVLSVPMYNLNVPSTLKAFFDRIARAGVTFSYTENGPKGHVTGKKATVVCARGGVYSGSPMDTQTPYITNFLQFIGFEDITFYYVEGLSMGEESANKAWKEYKEKINELFSVVEH
ncbi:FMN-dependent NADH-azoreductase [Glaciecola sp. 1036]|uniref:FMN-dependent NADH-azoreductase n=1 Tax=Alteromonadaceae TaxID=72275 RepID=UPI003D02F034